MPKKAKVESDNLSLNENWVSMDGITEYLDISRETVLRWIKKGMPGHKLGKVWKFKRSEVDEWIRSGAAADDDTKEEQSNGES
jgi:excisionase family DNA binding protein